MLTLYVLLHIQEYLYTSNNVYTGNNNMEEVQ